MVPRIDAGEMVHVCDAIFVAVVPSQRATDTCVAPSVDSVKAVQVAASRVSCDAGAPVDVENCCSSNVGLTMCT